MHVNEFGGETCASKRLQQYLAPTAANGRDGNHERGWVATDGFLHDFSGARKQTVFDHGLVVSRCGGNWDAKHCEHDNKRAGGQPSVVGRQLPGKSLFCRAMLDRTAEGGGPDVFGSITSSGCPHVRTLAAPKRAGFCCRTAGVSGIPFRHASRSF